MITFTVPSVPIAQPRQRHRIAGKFVMNYTPTNAPVNAFKAACQMALAEAYSGPPLEGPLVLSVEFILPRPKSLKGTGRSWHTKRPDIDNLLKSFKDSMKGLAWRDDSQVCQVIASKIVARADEPARAEVRIELMETKAKENA